MEEKRKNSKTDYKRIDSMKDKDIDYSDIEELDDEFWAKAKLVVPRPEAKNKTTPNFNPYDLYVRA